MARLGPRLVQSVKVNISRAHNIGFDTRLQALKMIRDSPVDAESKRQCQAHLTVQTHPGEARPAEGAGMVVAQPEVAHGVAPPNAAHGVALPAAGMCGTADAEAQPGTAKRQTCEHFQDFLDATDWASILDLNSYLRIRCRTVAGRMVALGLLHPQEGTKALAACLPLLAGFTHKQILDGAGQESVRMVRHFLTKACRRFPDDVGARILQYPRTPHALPPRSGMRTTPRHRQCDAPRP